MLGEGNREEVRRIREKYSDFERVDGAYQELSEYWKKKISALQIWTPNEGMNTLINTWTLYQSEINVMFSRFASFIEVGGRVGLGYRDTAQDAMTIPHSNPDKCRERIEQLLKGLTTTGYGLHLFSPEWFETDTGEKPFRSPTVVPEPDKKSMVHTIKDACSDDALWLVGAVVEYIKETGDISFARREYPYADTYVKSEDFTESVYEHLKRILDFSTQQVGNNGICKGLRADWNDCLNLGDGESALVSFLHYWALMHFVSLAKYLGENADAAHYQQVAENVKQACDKMLWDGEWYIRGITKNGRKIGCQEDREGRVHLESNAWAAACVCGRGDLAMKFYDALCPYWQNDKIEIREAEPYSYCQFIAGKEHTAYGRARHPFMTGSGGWAYFSATRYMLGIKPQFDYLEINPCIPSQWEGFVAIRRWRGAIYRIRVENRGGVMTGVKKILVDGECMEKVLAFAEGTEHEVVVIMDKMQ